MITNKAYLYAHYRFDKKEIFYIGIGYINNYGRAKDFKHHRSQYHKNITNKSNVAVLILLDNLTWEEACLKEIEYISKYGRKDLGTGSLVNMTNGGDGVVGKICSLETRQLLSKKFKGRKGKPHSQETKDKIGKAGLGRPNKNKGGTISQEQKEKISNTLKGNILSEETKNKISETQKFAKKGNNTSGYSNVFLYKDGRKKMYGVQYRIDKKTHKKSFFTMEEAIDFIQAMISSQG